VKKLVVSVLIDTRVSQSKTDEDESIESAATAALSLTASAVDVEDRTIVR
jgi:hypothetical protein